jgi:hypothetical protein
MGRYTTEWLQYRIRECWKRRNNSTPKVQEVNRKSIRHDVKELRRRKRKSAELSLLGY